MVIRVRHIIQRIQRILQIIIVFRRSGDRVAVEGGIPDVDIVFLTIDGIIADGIRFLALFLHLKETALVQIHRIRDTGTLVGDGILQFPRSRCGCSIRIVLIDFKFKHFTTGGVLSVYLLAKVCVGGGGFLQLLGA